MTAVCSLYADDTTSKKFAGESHLRGVSEMAL
eukprot:SAG31_NODE_34686_length_330_cov_1.108225_1_plen_31_part_10